MAPTTVLGTCHHDCPDSCGWVATVDEGRVVSLRGNPDHPYSRGELCPKVSRFVHRVYAPDRLLHPLIRTGAKGGGPESFRRASWDEALALVADRVGALVDEHGGETVLTYFSAGTQGLIQMSCLDRPFFAGLGASRSVGSVCGAVAGAGFAATHGTGRCADPMRTLTAEAADWFVQPLPGTDSALVLGMLHVLLRDDLVDHDYVERYTTGFAELAAQAAGWTPERAARAASPPPPARPSCGPATSTTAPPGCPTTSWPTRGRRRWRGRVAGIRSRCSRPRSTSDS